MRNQACKYPGKSNIDNEKVRAILKSQVSSWNQKMARMTRTWARQREWHKMRMAKKSGVKSFKTLWTSLEFILKAKGLIQRVFLIMHSTIYWAGREIQRWLKHGQRGETNAQISRKQKIRFTDSQQSKESALEDQEWAHPKGFKQRSGMIWFLLR